MIPDLASTIAGVRLGFAAMNAAGTAQSPEDLRRLLASRAGAMVVGPTTVHPFVHPEFRGLHNVGFDKYAPLVRELTAASDKPVIASIAGTTAEELALLARAFAESGAALVEIHLADPWIAAAVQPFEDMGRLREMLAHVVRAAVVPVAVRLPAPLPLPAVRLGVELVEAGVRVATVSNEFTTFERLRDEVRGELEFIVVGGIHSGYDVTRALEKGASAVQADLAREGFGLFARLEREMRIARGALREQVP